ncbi:MAG: DUF4118 domain-containing protein [Fimbriimonas sp.]|nr:DUF4118 domain-containing protein [Fimbriimonas sp.]
MDRKTLAPYLETLVVVVIIASIQFMANSLMEERSRYSLMLIGTCYGTWRGGKGPGIFALLFSGLIGAYFLTPQRFSLVVQDILDSINLLLYLVVGSVIILFGEALRKERQLVQQREQDLRLAHEELEKAHLSIEQLLQKRQDELTEIKRFVADEEFPGSATNPHVISALFDDAVDNEVDA